ncbi:MAG: diphosphate--fructose-6-phosphate 1-phosphotransferase [bacterium]|nr:diphosphate--fructose-6-phosphate 1-phosphotransferase [bacterium]
MEKKAVAIVVGGGPAPGINGVISAVTIEAINRGHKVYGVRDGFEHISLGKTSQVSQLTISDVSWIHSEGGSILRTSRANPTKNKEHLNNVVNVFKELGVGYLVTIGGDDTAHSARVVADTAGGAIAVAHVPKTIDNDLPLQGKASTFGYQTARDVGTEIVDTLMRDARSTSRWYLVNAMGRKAGHLALGIAVASGAPLCLIPEEFEEEKIKLSSLVDTIVGSILKRAASDRRYGVAVLAEGLAEKLDVDSIPELASAERDPHGHIRYAEIDFGGILRRAVRARLKEFNIDLPVVDKNVGYELRCCAPVPFDREYTKQLGFGVVDFLLSGGSGAMITRQGDKLDAIPFSQLIDPHTNKTIVRYVDIKSPLYRVATRYMIRLTESDLRSDTFVARLAELTGVSSAVIRQEFSHCVAVEGLFPDRLEEI